MMMESKGYVFYIWKKPEYGMMAYQFAMSMKFHAPSVPIHLITDKEAVSRLRNLSYFDTIQYVDTPVDPAQAKIDMYDLLPFDHNVFLDADGLCVSEMESTLDNFINGDKPFSCFVHAYYNQNDPEDMPLMVWAKRDTIWNHYGLSNHTLPASQSSMLYIRKGAVCDEIYSRMASNYANRIPLEQLKNKWGGGQPDELYLNVTLAQMGYDPACPNVIYFADNRTLTPHQIKHQYKILSLFGTAGNVTPVFERFYNGEVKEIARQLGAGITYEWKNLKGSKHANIRQAVHKKQAFKGGFIRSEKITNEQVKSGRTLLFSSYYDHNHAGRQRELDTCLMNNLNSPEIDHVYLYCESGSVPSHPKLTAQYNGRPTYQNLIDWANDIAQDGDVVVIANSDIYFDETLNWAHNVHMESTMIALSRWDVLPNGTKRLFAYEHSQDTWIFKGKIRITGADYFMGLPGCDNKIAYDANHQGYRVVNTAKDIITYHLHNTNERNYTQEDRLAPPYLPVFITSIRELKSNKLLIKQPGKVGDIVICLPIAKHYADRGYSVEWECPAQYHAMFNYVSYATPVVTGSGEYSRTIDISFGLNKQSSTNIAWAKHKRTGSSFVNLKYELAGVDVKERNNLKYNRNETAENNLFSDLGLNDAEPFILFHGASDYGTPVNLPAHSLKVVEFGPVGNYTIFDWRKVIEKATEIHCIDSSLANFVEVVPTSAELHYYKTDRVPGASDETILTKNWVRHG
jgi:hypothetical protein